MTIANRRLLALGLLLCATARLTAQQIKEVALGPSTGKVDHDFSRVTGGAALPDGRFVVADPKEAAVFVLDFTTHTAVQLGRIGQGPNEYTNPFGVLKGPGDTLVIASSGGQFVRIDPAGKLAGSYRFALSPGSGGMTIPRAIDNSNRFYWGSDFIVIDQGKVHRNRFPSIKRWTAGSTDAAVVIATFADHAEAMAKFRFHPYAELDAWAVAPDGRVAVLVAADYHLRWIRDGKVEADEKPVAFTRVAVGPAEREAYWAMRAQTPAGNASMPGSTAVTQEVGIQRAREAYTVEMFPASMPPFEENGLWLSPGGDLWVARTRPAADSVPRIDILTANGSLKASLRLPVRRQVLALDRSGVYLVHTDNDGLQRVERYGYPTGMK